MLHGHSTHQNVPSSHPARLQRFSLENMHTTDRHPHKRPFQPSITSYFARDDSAFSDSDDQDDIHLRGLTPITRSRPQHQVREALAPPLPGPVQTDLMQVGMRVRKSVPEGYKTHHNKMMALPSIQTTLSHPNSTTTTITLDVKASIPDEVIHQRELLPFCGLQKIGGFAEQPTTNIHLYAGVDASTGTRPTNMFPLNAETFSQPFHFSSQDSGYESVYANANPSKRSWHDEDDVINGRSAFVFSKGPVVEVEEVPVSPLSATPENMLPPVRRVKMPKSRRQKALSMQDVDMDGVTVIHVDRRIAAGSGSDFEEADFLNEGEVVMGGV
jgi:hypothetical protein